MWVTPQEAMDQWADAPDDLTVLASYLQAAYEQCVAFLPAGTWPVDGVTTIPERWKLAQIMQARALYRSGLAGDGNQIGVDGLQVTVFPMDWTVKNLLRPRRVGRVL
ncbi:hypothetical protein ICW40_01170 [Actinotalea ferrariae]|uniref:hypothetical protein n=1 Tax=Actinotalea ferrariae TaxID=1386098 RepID=UPI001C8B663E|nr:hypothetical protein [Actinotalea ferrariae]MBX9243416.1 hypothetical protein [Actinotalea ferrariae]